MIGIYIRAGLAIAVLAAIAGAYAMGARHEGATRDAAAANGRIENITGVREENRNVENLDDDGFFNSISRWFVPDGDT